MQATAKFVPMEVSGILTGIVVAFILGIVSSQLLVIIGLVGTTTASLLFALIDPSLTYWAMAFPAMLIVVLGADLMYNVCTMYVTSAVAMHEQALAGGIFNTVTQIGTALGLAVTSIVASSVTGTSTAPEDVLNGYRAGFWMAFALGCVGLIISFSLTGIGKVGAKKKEEEEIEGKEDAEVENSKGKEDVDVVVVIPKEVENDKGLDDVEVDSGKKDVDVVAVIPKDVENGENSEDEVVT